MSIYRSQFSLSDDIIWLNSASEGPLPNQSTTALLQAIQWKQNPYQLTIPKFISASVNLKKSIGTLFQVDSNNVILGNSASYGLHILANGISWNEGDEIITMCNDFPTNILPWMALTKKGIKVHQIQAKNVVLSVDELLQVINSKTRLVCLSSVHTFSGKRIDIEKMSVLCREKGILFVANLTQSAGTEPINLSEGSFDAAVFAGYKWLCGPYGTGFAWFSDYLMSILDYNHAYWIDSLDEKTLQSENLLEMTQLKQRKSYDVFGTANFFNFIPLKESIDFFIQNDLEQIYNYNQGLIARVIEGIDRSKYNIISDETVGQRSNLFYCSYKNAQLNETIFELLKQKGVYISLWKNRLRLSPHVFNTEEEIDKTLDLLNSFKD